MPRRRDAALATAEASRRSLAARLRPRSAAARIGLIAALLLVVSIVRYLLNNPSLAVALYALIPIVLAVYWFELPGGLITAAVATGLFIAD
jgi:hypothetical protein